MPASNMSISEAAIHVRGYLLKLGSGAFRVQCCSSQYHPCLCAILLAGHQRIFLFYLPYTLEHLSSNPCCGIGIEATVLLYSA